MKRILLIDDDIEIRDNIAEILEMENYQVITAENGMMGMGRAIIWEPDLIISDVTMPELNGFEMLKELQKSVKTGQIPFIFLTARSDKDYINAGEELGAAYLIKPFDGDELLRIVAEKLEEYSNLNKV